ncbi:unnamed protein product [Brassica oleracea]
MFQIYVGSWFVVAIIMLIVKVLGEASPGGTNSHCAFRTTKLVVFLTSVINVIGITVVHLATFGDLFLCMVPWSPSSQPDGDYYLSHKPASL